VADGGRIETCPELQGREIVMSSGLFNSSQDCRDCSDFFADEELDILEFPESFGKPKVEKKIFDKQAMRWISMAVNFRLEYTLGP
jgi:hypothetical protein